MNMMCQCMALIIFLIKYYTQGMCQSIADEKFKITIIHEIKVILNKNINKYYTRETKLLFKKLNNYSTREISCC
jgi:hypothetical protein